MDTKKTSKREACEEQILDLLAEFKTKAAAIAEKAGLDEDMMYNTFNMGIGMVVAVSPEDAEKAVACFESAGDKAYIIGDITSGEKGVTLC